VAARASLTSNDAQLNLAGALQYTFEFFDVKIDGVYTPEAIPNITYDAPADSTAIDLIEQIDTAGIVGITPLPQVPSTGISDATPFSRQIITAPDAATVNALLGDNPAMSGSAVLTTSTAPTLGQITRYNATGGALSPPLPALSGLSAGALYGVQKYQGDASANTVTFTAAGSDKFDDTTTTTLVLKLTGELRLLQVFKVGATKFWKVVGGNTPIASMDSRYVRGSVYDSTGTIQPTKTVHVVLDVNGDIDDIVIV
jgi:hypothetical protein